LELSIRGLWLEKYISLVLVMRPNFVYHVWNWSL